jgi:hypothetical protein
LESKESIFIEYFENEWLSLYSGWYEGHTDGPSTNNALEVFHRVIKCEETNRERLKMDDFTKVLFNMLQGWSKDRDPDYSNCAKFHVSPSIDLSDKTNAYQWCKQKKTIVSRGDNHYIPSSTNKDVITDESIDKYLEITSKRSWKTFNSFSKFYYSIWTVNLNTECVYPSTISPEDVTMSASCNCLSFLKKYVCKHTIGMCAMKKIYSFPPEAENILLTEKRKTWSPN